MKKVFIILLILTVSLVLCFSLNTFDNYTKVKSTSILLKYNDYKILKQYEVPSDNIHSADEMYNLTYSDSTHLAKNEKDFVLVELQLQASLSEHDVECDSVEVMLSDDFKNKNPFIFCRYEFEKDLKVPNLTHEFQNVNLELIVHKDYFKDDNMDVLFNTFEFEIKYYVKKSFVSIKKSQDICLASYNN